MILQPAHNLRGVGVGDAEAFSILLGREPLMVVRRLRIVLRVEQLVKGILLRRVRKQSEEHVLQGKAGRDCACVVSRDGERMHVAPQRHSLLIVNVAGDAVPCLGERRVRRIGCGLRRQVDRKKR